tara:strand:- start:1640 stop:2140 length:501 start_codon:yes stop_codon:yes gene_type:complete
MAEPDTGPGGTPPSILVRSARLDELSLLLEFEQGIITAERPYDHTLKPEPISYYDIGERIESDDAEVAVVEVDGLVVASGYAEKKPSKHYIREAHHAFLGFMFVRPEYRGQGLNKVLLDYLFVWAKSKGLPEIRLTVYSTNEPAIRAYEKAGFSPCITEMRLNLDE